MNITIILLIIFFILLPFAPVCTYMQISEDWGVGAKMPLHSALKIRHKCRKYGQIVHISLPF